MVWPDRQQPIKIDPSLFDWRNMPDQKVREAYLRHGNQALVETLHNLGILRIIDFADRDTVTDSEGKRYWNAQAGYGSTPFGGELDFITEAIWGEKLPLRCHGFHLEGDGSLLSTKLHFFNLFMPVFLIDSSAFGCCSFSESVKPSSKENRPHNGITVLLRPEVSALLMSASSIIVATNAVMLKRVETKLIG